MLLVSTIIVNTKRFMKKILFLLAIFACFTSYAQEKGTKFYFKEIGWKVTLPNTFVMATEEENKNDMQRGVNLIENANDVVVEDLSDLKDLISATKGDNYINATISPYHPETDGDYLENGEAVKQIIYRTFENMPNATLDSSSSKVVIDNLSFEKFSIKLTINKEPLLTMILISRLYKGYDFGITYLYQDENTKQEIEKMLSESKFDK